MSPLMLTMLPVIDSMPTNAKAKMMKTMVAPPRLAALPLVIRAGLC